ncbi:hypothetical protein N7491_009920 [Penicillium cf. griseofulvum]|uniref:Gfo/Idh/MocA-like oxidoreductase N-terminal domain-containing protein n=1 Tax=Penicillium cf. griseofulvum TaxID=2972120 RepID=A0A9W9T5C4_9EURO|nr:hypothetical protein N7472_000247 [Penicillium cf. griseofulvum]KAJ5421475.1 hypothetical protein N7491_009920 [Penicillium cf. griseofulvum]KAJ5424707.1 hypothetical protein N7445_010680 [Penicillium cf. griseofulvum]
MSQFWQSLQGLRSRILPFAQRTLIFRRVSSFKLLLISEQKRDYNVALIGLGWRGYRTHFLSLVDSPSVSVVAVCDTDQNTLQSFSAQHPTIHTYSSITQLLQHHTLDFAVLSVPHAFHLDCVVALSEKGVPILKEKPVAESCDEYSQMRNFSVPIGITFQKRFEPQFLHLKSLLPLIGDATAIQASLTLNITHLDENWRADTGVGVTVCNLHYEASGA